MQHIGGWWRLWIVISFPVFVLVLVNQWPQIPEAELLQEMLSKSQKDLAIVSAKTGVQHEVIDRDGNSKTITAPPDIAKNDVLDYGRRRLSDDWQPSTREIENEISNIQSWVMHYEEIRISKTFLAILKASLIPITLLIIGMSASWIMSGFRKPKD